MIHAAPQEIKYHVATDDLTICQANYLWHIWLEIGVFNRHIKKRTPKLLIFFPLPKKKSVHTL